GNGQKACFIAGFCFTSSAFRVETVDDAVLDFLRVAEDIARIEANDLGEVADARGVVVGQARLDHVLDFVAQNRFRKDLRERWRHDLKRPFKRLAIDTGSAGYSETGSVGNLVLRVVGIAQGNLRAEVPALEVERHSYARENVEASNEIVSHKAGFAA